MSDLIGRLKDLHIQATKERSHYYVGSLVTESIATIEKLEARIAKLRGALANIFRDEDCNAQYVAELALSEDDKESAVSER